VLDGDTMVDVRIEEVYEAGFAGRDGVGEERIVEDVIGKWREKIIVIGEEMQAMLGGDVAGGEEACDGEEAGQGGIYF